MLSVIRKAFRMQDEGKPNTHIAAWTVAEVGPMSGTMGIVLTFLGIAIALYLGPQILGNMESALPDLTGDWANTSTTVGTVAAAAFGLMVVILIVLAARGILQTLFGMFG